MTTYRIDQHGPYGRWILVGDGVDISAHVTRGAAEMAQLKAIASEAATAGETGTGSTEGESAGLKGIAQDADRPNGGVK